MIQSVEVFNFQSIERAKLAFGKVTVLVGDSNVGKTALLRAIRGLIDNTSSNEILRNGCSELKVVLQTDKNIITWYKGPGINIYNIDGKELKGVGRSSPELLETILGFATRRILGFDFNPNFRDQFSPPMLIFESESERLVKLGIISGVGLLQTAVRIASKDRKGFEGSVRQVGEDLRLNELALRGYDGLDSKLSSADSLRSTHTSLVSRSAVLARVHDLRDRRTVLYSLLSLPGGAAEERMGRARSRTNLIRQAIDLQSVRSASAAIGRGQIGLTDRSQFAWVQKAIDLQIVRKAIRAVPDKDLNALRFRLLIAQAATKLLMLRRGHNPLVGDVHFAERSLEAKVEERKSLLKALRVCPVCQTNLAGN